MALDAIYRRGDGAVSDEMRALTREGERETERAIEIARDEIEGMHPIVAVYFASGLMQVAIDVITSGCDAETRAAIARDILSNLGIPPLN